MVHFVATFLGCCLIFSEAHSLGKGLDGGDDGISVAVYSTKESVDTGLQNGTSFNLPAGLNIKAFENFTVPDGIHPKFETFLRTNLEVVYFK